MGKVNRGICLWSSFVAGNVQVC